MSVTLIVPTILETETTGFFVAVEAKCRNKTHRCEIWKSGEPIRCTIEGEKSTWEKMSASVRKAIHTYLRAL